MPQRILIVEDETEIATYLRRGLAYEGFTVEIAREHMPDVVVLDLMLPGLDGMEVAQRLRAGSSVPIIMLTARDSVADRVAGLERGADDYLVKPFAFEELLELFMRHPRQVLTRVLLYERIWGYDFGGESNVIEVYIRALRQKLESAGAPRLIHTLRGVGYVLREDA